MPAPNLAAGMVQDGVYRNDYFGLTLPIPSAWSFVDAQVAEQALAASREEVIGGDDALGNSMQESITRSSALFIVMDNAADPRVVTFATAESVVNITSVETGEDYLERALPDVAKTVGAQWDGSLETVELGGHQFARADIVLGERFGGDRRTFLATVIRRHVLAFVVSGWEEQAVEEGVSMLRNAVFSPDPGPAPLSDRQIQSITGGGMFILGALIAVLYSLFKRRRASTSHL